MAAVLSEAVTPDLRTVTVTQATAAKSTSPQTTTIAMAAETFAPRPMERPSAPLLAAESPAVILASMIVTTPMVTGAKQT